MWMFKTYKSKKNGYGEPTAAVTRRINSLTLPAGFKHRPFDLGKKEDRKIVGYCYLEWKENI